MLNWLPGFEIHRNYVSVMNKKNAALEKSYQFALDSIQIYMLLIQKKEYVIAKQLLRCGTSIGANVEEATGGGSRRDFGWKMSIAYKEAREAHFWLRLLRDSKYLTQEEVSELLVKADELLRILGSIQKTVLARNFSK